MIRRARSLGLAVTVWALGACSPAQGTAPQEFAGASGLGAGTGGKAAGGAAGSPFAGSANGGGSQGGTGNAGAAGNGVSGGASVAGAGPGGSGGAIGSAGASGATGATGAAGASGASSTGDIVGKITVGYQGWFNAAADGSGINPPWWHWTADRNTPTPTNKGIKSWPDMSEYTKSYATGFPNLGNGSAAKLFSNWDAQTVEVQVKWMKDAGIDTIALQRFGDLRGTGEARNVVAGHVRNAAQTHGRKFYPRRVRLRHFG